MDFWFEEQGLRRDYEALGQNAIEGGGVEVQWICETVTNELGGACAIGQ